MVVRNNLDVRERIKRSNVRQWMIADKLGMSESKLSVKLRVELEPTEKERIYKAIREIEAELVSTNSKASASM